MRPEILVKAYKEKHLYSWAACVFAFSIPFYQMLSTIVLVLWLFVSLTNLTNSNLSKKRGLLLLPALFLSYLLGFALNADFSVSILERKLSLLVFPLIFCLNSFSTQQIQKIFKWFIIGLFFSSIVCLVKATYNSIHIIQGGFYFRPNVLEGRAFFESIMYGGNYFFGNHLSLFHQTVYYGLFLVSGIAILLYNAAGFQSKRIRFGLIVLFLVLIFLLSNKSTFVAVWALFLIWTLSQFNNLEKKGMLVLAFLAFSTIIVFFNPRSRTAIYKITNEKLEINKEGRYGFATRLLSWDAAVTLIKKRPLQGYGASRAQTELNRLYKEKGYIYPLKDKLNSHNLFMQLWIENGVLAALVLIVTFISMAVKSLKIKYRKLNLLGITLVCILFITALFESMFSRFSGIFFFSFMVCMILGMYRNNFIKLTG